MQQLVTACFQETLAVLLLWTLTGVFGENGTLWADLNAVYFRQSLTCPLGLTSGLIDGGQPRAKPHLRKVKPNHVLKTVFSPRLATVYQVVGKPKSTR